MTILSYLKDALISRGSSILELLISIAFWVYLLKKNFSWSNFFGNFFMKVLHFLKDFKFSPFSCCFKKSRAEKLAEIAQRYSEEYDTLSQVDAEDLEALDYLKSIKNTRKKINKLLQTIN